MEQTKPTAPDTGTRDRRICWLLFLALLTCYAYFPPRWGDWNQNSRLSLVMAMVDRGTLHIEGYYDGVLQTGDYALYNGRVYSTKPPGTAFLGVPVYWGLSRVLDSRPLATVIERIQRSETLARTLREDGSGLPDGKVRAALALYLVTLITVSAPSALLGVLLYRFTGHLVPEPAPRIWAVLLYGLGTDAFPYSGAFYSHQIVAVMLFAAFALAHRIAMDRQRPAAALGVGMLLGYAVITEHPAALIAAPLFVYLAVKQPDRRQIGLTLLGGMLPGALWVAYNLVIFGRPIAFAYEHEPLFRDVNTTGFFSLTYPQADALWGITFSSYRGLFFLSPALLAAIPGMVALARRRAWRAEFWVCLWASVAFVLFNGSSVMWQGGHAIGPRYLVPMLPFMVPPLALAASRWGRLTWARRVLGLSTSWSFLAIWAETLGGQSFPGYTLNPLFRHSLPLLAKGDIARNLGAALGLPGWASLLPLALAMTGIIGLLVFWTQHQTRQAIRPVGAR
jgi:hypothetical protein